MDISVSGNGKISAGEYQNIAIHGNAKLCGLVKCTNLKSSGSLKGESIECLETFKANGNAYFYQSIKAENLYASGNLFSEGDLTIGQNISCSGRLKSQGTIRCKQLSISGSARTNGEIQTNNAIINGNIRCNGLYSAENIQIRFDGKTSLGSAHGNQITISMKTSRKIWKSWLIFPLFIKKYNKNAHADSLNGNEINVEYTNCPQVTGKTITIGKGCYIQLAQYSEKITISPRAKVEKIVKI